MHLKQSESVCKQPVIEPRANRDPNCFHTHYLRMLYIAELQELDRELNEWFRGPPSASSKHNTYMNKYFKFCAVTGVPVLPLSLITFCRYAKWLPENNINSGWPDVKSYIGALAQFNVSMGGPDPRAENPALWSLLRTRFKQNTQIKRTTTLKFALRGGHIQALCLLACDSNTPQSIADAASDTLMQFSAVRVGHIAPKDTKNLQHVLSWHHLEFIRQRAKTVLDCTRKSHLMQIHLPHHLDGQTLLGQLHWQSERSYLLQHPRRASSPCPVPAQTATETHRGHAAIPTSSNIQREELHWHLLQKIWNHSTQQSSSSQQTVDAPRRRLCGPSGHPDL